MQHESCAECDASLNEDGAYPCARCQRDFCRGCVTAFDGGEYECARCFITTIVPTERRRDYARTSIAETTAERAGKAD